MSREAVVPALSSAITIPCCVSSILACLQIRAPRSSPTSNLPGTRARRRRLEIPSISLTCSAEHAARRRRACPIELTCLRVNSAISLSRIPASPSRNQGSQSGRSQCPTRLFRSFPTMPNSTAPQRRSDFLQRIYGKGLGGLGKFFSKSWVTTLLSPHRLVIPAEWPAKAGRRAGTHNPSTSPKAGSAVVASWKLTGLIGPGLPPGSRPGIHPG